MTPNKQTILELMKVKFKLEEENINKFQKIESLKRERLQNIKQLDIIENKIREEFSFMKIPRRSEVR